MQDKPYPAPPSVLEANEVLTAYRLSWVANFLSGPIYKEIEARHGLSRPEFIVLFNCHHRPGSTARDICLATGRPKNSISRAVLVLARDGRLVQQPNPEDARQKRLVLTAAGEALYAAVIPLFKQREREMLSVLTDEERTSFEVLLAKLALRSDGWAEVF
ncbi:MAG: winged helix-turn-helix transcriptional regulator [Methylobacteriaceae bacterium]|nr:winged helix-turn-helix transcriptional regulator [Methylobacteriaceae bacterium]